MARFGRQSTIKERELYTESSARRFLWSFQPSDVGKKTFQENE